MQMTVSFGDRTHTDFSIPQEATDKVITLHDDEPEMVARMLLCLYTSNYPSLFRKGKPSESPSLRDFLLQGCVASEVDHFEYETNPLMVHSKVYAIAEKYDIPGLQAVSVTKFDLNRIPTRSEIKNLLVALAHVYTSTPPSANALRLKAAALVQKSYNDIMYNPKLKAQLETACVRNGQLGWDVLSNLFNRRSLRCADCDDEIYKPFSDDFSYNHELDVCICALTKLCGSGVCSKSMEDESSCPSCDVDQSKMIVKEY